MVSSFPALRPFHVDVERVCISPSPCLTISHTRIHDTISVFISRQLLLPTKDPYTHQNTMPNTFFLQASNCLIWRVPIIILRLWAPAEIFGIMPLATCHFMAMAMAMATSLPSFQASCPLSHEDAFGMAISQQSQQSRIRVRLGWIGLMKKVKKVKS